MPLGVLEDTKLEHVPGTAPLSELGHARFSLPEGTHAALKHDPTGQIVLIPQPSDSPNDPYNWPRMKKELFTIAMIWSIGCTGALGPILGPSLVPLSIKFGVSLQSFVGGVQGGILVANGIGSLLFNALAVKYGKRPVYLGTTVGLLVTSFWCAAAKNFASLVAARVIQGCCMGPFEALIPTSIADVWFVHERGFRTAIYTIATLSGISLSQPIAGQIIQYGSYEIAFYAIGGGFALQFILIFFWMPETAFKRHTVSLDTGAEALVSPLTVEPKREVSRIMESKEVDTAVASSQSSELPDLKISWTQELRLYSGYVNNISIWSTIYRPFIMLGSLPVVWATIIYTLCISWLVILSIVLSQVFAPPPYSFSIGAVGATNTSSFVASILGMLVSGPILDGVARRMARKSSGIFEPEFRLPVMIGYLAFTATGTFVWGYSLSVYASWPIPVIVGLGFMSFGIQLAITSLVTYVVDCHREKASEAMAVLNFFKAMIGFVFTETLNDWITDRGVRSVFYTLGGLSIGASLTTIPMYIYGKKARSWAFRHNIEGRA